MNITPGVRVVTTEGLHGMITSLENESQANVLLDTGNLLESVPFTDLREETAEEVAQFSVDEQFRLRDMADRMYKFTVHAPLCEAWKAFADTLDDLIKAAA